MQATFKIEQRESAEKQIKKTGTAKLFFTQHIGEFETEDGQGIILVKADHSPVIRMPDGTDYSLSWQSILETIIELHKAQ